MGTDKTYRLICEHIIRLLREERKRQGLSKYALEQRCGVSQQMVGYVERGLRRPSLETAIRIAGGLEIDFGDMFHRAKSAAVDGKRRKPPKGG